MRIGIDIGGTNIRMALVDNGKIAKRISEPCKADQREEIVTEHLIEMLKQIFSPSVESIGIGVPSIVDAELGIVYDVMNIPSWKEVHLKEILEKEFKIPVHVNNDCNCFVYGEHCFGKCNQFKDTLGITLGTGLGCAIIINNVLYNGSNTGAGEICDIPYLKHNYEYYCSTPFFVKEYNTNAKELFEKACRGDIQALKLWNEFGTHVGNMIKMVLYAYDPQCIVMGGSIVKAYLFFEKAMRKSLETFAYPKTIQKIKIFCSEVEDAALLGAAMLG